MGTSVFLCGMMRHAPLCAVVIGREPPQRPAGLAGHAVVTLETPGLAGLRPVPGAKAEGLLIDDLSADEAARLDHYMACLGATPHRLTVRTPEGPNAARVHLPRQAPQAGEGWTLADWMARHGALSVEVAREILALLGQRAPEDIFRRYRQMLVRAAARLQAQAQPPVPLARQASPGDVRVGRWRQPYAQFFALEEYDLRFRRFDGTMSEVVRREVFISGDAASVLPYDPLRDRVLVIEQFRPGPFARGDAQPWLIEPIAGRVDPGETPAQAVRREAEEEAGLTLGRLMPVAGFYPTPAAKAEYLHAFLGLADLPDDWRAGASGQEDEHEDIRAHLLGFDALMGMVDAGQLRNGPLLVLALFLARAREGLRRAA